MFSMFRKMMCLVSFVLVLLLMPTLCTAQQAIPENLVLYLPCEDAQNPVDASPDPTTVDVNGTLTTAEGKFGTNGLVFPDWSDKQENRLKVATAPKLEGMSALTITAWVLPRNVVAHNGQMSIVSKRLGLGGSDEYNVFVYPYPTSSAAYSRVGVVQARVNGNVEMALASTTVIEDDNWYHVAFTFDGGAGGGEKVKLYINGVLEDSGGHPSSSVVVGDPPAPVWISVLDGDKKGLGWDGIMDDISIWTAALSEEDIARVMTKGIAKVLRGELASTPIPANEATDLPRDNAVLNWAPGNFADKHDVYFGTDFDDVNDATATVDPAGVYVGLQSETAVALDRLELGQTYYWRIDEVNAPPDLTVFKGDVWSFTVEPAGLQMPSENITATASSSNSEVEDPNNTINGSGLDVNDLDLHSTQGTDMWLSDSEPLGAWIQYEFDKIYKLHEVWVWNSNQMAESTVGFGLRAVTIEYSANGIDWIELGDVPEFAQAPGTDGYAHNTTVDLSGITAKYVRLTASSNWGGILPKYGLSEVRFFSIPVFAREPYPDSGATDVDVDVVLGFRAGRDAVTHNVYLSSDEQAVIDGNAPVTTVTENSYSPSPLDVDSTYYWRVDEVNEAETTTTWQGDIWNLSTQEYCVVDDFESYNEIAAGEEGSNLVYLTWIDGYDNPLVNGSTMGHTVAFEPSMESVTVYDGKQSAPLYYDNSTAGYSEATVNVAELQVGQDWTKHGIKALTLRFSGDPNNAVQQMYVKVNGSKVTYDGDAENLKRIGWQMWYIDLSSLGVSLSNVTELSIGFERSGAVGGQGVVYFDGIRLYSHDRQLTTPVEPNDSGLMGYYPLDEGAGNTATDMSGNGHDGTLYNGVFLNSVTWISQGFINGGINIDGTASSHIKLGTWDPAEGTGQLSLALWINWAGSGNTNQGLIGKRDAWNVNEMMFGFRLSDASIRLLRAGSTVSTAGGVMTPFIGEWAHVAVTFDGTTARIYLNGEEIQSGGFSFGNKTTADMRIGAYSNASDSFNGDIDEVRIYNRVLSPTEIAWLSGMTLPFDEPF